MLWRRYDLDIDCFADYLHSRIVELAEEFADAYHETHKYFDFHEKSNPMLDKFADNVSDMFFRISDVTAIALRKQLMKQKEG